MRCVSSLPEAFMGPSFSNRMMFVTWPPSRSFWERELSRDLQSPEYECRPGMKTFTMA